MLSAVDARFDPCKWQENFFHLSPKAPFPLCSLLHQCVSVFCGPPFQRVALRRLVSLYIFSPLHSQPLSASFSLSLSISHSFSLSSSRRLPVSFFLQKKGRETSTRGRQHAKLHLSYNIVAHFSPRENTKEAWTVLSQFVLSPPAPTPTYIYMRIVNNRLTFFFPFR